MIQEISITDRSNVKHGTINYNEDRNNETLTNPPPIDGWYKKIMKLKKISSQQQI